MKLFNYTTLLPRQCEFCQSRSGLLRCSGCHVVSYCGRDHQIAHRYSHKHACVTIKKAHAAFSKEEISLRNNPGDGFFLPPRVFEDHAGHFWDLMDTRAYMRARFHFVDTILGHCAHHRVAVQTALDHFMDMLRLNRSDNMGLRNKIPSLMLRLGREQDAYDFVKWWATCDPHGLYDWGNMELPYLDTKAADLLEEPSWWTCDFLELSHAAAVMLIKLRVLLNLKDLQNTARALEASPLPMEIIEHVRGKFLDDGPLAGQPNLAFANAVALAGRIVMVKKQIRALYSAVKEANLHFWSRLINMQDDEEKLQIPEAYSSGSTEEADLMVLYNYPAWEETPGALDQIDALNTWSLHKDETEPFRDGFEASLARMLKRRQRENAFSGVATCPPR